MPTGLRSFPPGLESRQPARCLAASSSEILRRHCSARPATQFRQPPAPRRSTRLPDTYRRPLRELLASPRSPSAPRRRSRCLTAETQDPPLRDDPRAAFPTNRRTRTAESATTSTTNKMNSSIVIPPPSFTGPGKRHLGHGGICLTSGTSLDTALRGVHAVRHSSGRAPPVSDCRQVCGLTIGRSHGHAQVRASPARPRAPSLA